MRKKNGDEKTTMAAVAYSVSMTIASGSPNGQRRIKNFSASDVTTEKWLADSGESSNVLDGNADAYIISCALSPATGTDCSQVEFYVGGELKKTIKTATLKYDATINPFAIAPFRVGRGMNFMAIQKT